MLLEPRVVRWPDWEQTLLTPKHLQVWQSNARKQILNCGRAFGKDHLHQLRGTRLMFELYERRKRLGWKRPGPVVHLGIAGPTSTNFADLWRRYKDMLPKIPGTSRDGTPNIHQLEDDQVIEILGRNEMLVSFGSAFRGDNVRGGGFDILIVTEAGMMSPKTIFGSLIKLVFRPGYTGYAMLNSTPRGRDCWWDAAAKECRNEQTKADGYYADWEFVEGTYLDNPLTTGEDITDADKERKQNLQRFQQERLAWLDVDVPDDVLLGDGVTLALSADLIQGVMLEAPYKPRPPFYAGLDLAGLGPDPLSVVIIDSRGIVCWVELHGKTDTEHILDIFQRTHDRWHPVKMSYDANGPIGKKVRGRLRLLNANPVTTRWDKAELVQHMEQHMIAGSCRVPHYDLCPSIEGAHQRDNLRQLLREMQTYRKIELQRERHAGGAKIKAETFVTYSKPAGGSDDILDGLSYALEPRPVPLRARKPVEETPDDERHVRRRDKVRLGW